MKEEITNFYTHESKNSPKNMVILLHGLGSNGQDLISLAPLLSAQLPDTVFISPDAPFACDMAPPDYPNSFQWFSLQSREPLALKEGTEMAAPILEAFITEQLTKYDLPADKCALLGFSQGTMMALHVGTRYKPTLAGVLGYSGAMAGGAGEQKLPVCLIHGEADDVVPVQAYTIAKQVLEALEFTVSGHTTAGLTHSIDEEGLRVGAAFLKDVLT